MLGLILSAVLCTDFKAPFIGTVCSPNDGKRHAAMVLLSGSEGGNSMRGFAHLFAQHGYVGASVAYFGMPGLPATLVGIPVETLKPAIAALQARSDVDAGRLGVLGGSKGGEFALLAASTYPQFKAVVALVPSPMAYMGLGENDMPEGCSWTLAGKPLPCIPADAQAGMQIGMEASAGQPIELKPFYEASREADPTIARAAMFHLERIDGPVLCLGAADDRMWNSSAQCTIAADYLRAHHHRYADRAIDYSSAGHLFYLALSGPKSAVINYAIPGSGASFAFGGTPQGDADAARSAWNTIWQFLDVALRG
jgi:dienelactone hydrolase